MENQSYFQKNSSLLKIRQHGNDNKSQELSFNWLGQIKVDIEVEENGKCGTR